MLKHVTGLLSFSCLIVSCAAPPQSAAPQASAGQSAAVTGVDAPSNNDDQNFESVYVPPQIGSHLGGGYVRVPRKVAGTDEKALIGNIIELNAAAGSTRERPFVVAAVSRVTGVSERELQAQQDTFRLRFGELCAINTIARGNTAKVHEIAMQRAKGQSWTQLAQANGLSVATIVETTRNAQQLTANSFGNSIERQKGGQQKLKDLGVRPQVLPGN
jgi:6,7-dimethyl-8-ribityllumazine synthase